MAANTGAAGAIHRVACFAGLPAPTGTAQASGSRCTCGSGRGREHRRSRCHPPRRLLRGHARSHRYCAGFGLTLYLWERPWPRTPAKPVPSTAQSASRVNPLPQVRRRLQAHAVPVGAALAANTGAAGAIHRVACFAGEPAPTGTAQASGSPCTCGSGRGREHRRSRCHPPRRLLRGLARSHRHCAGFGLTLYLRQPCAAKRLAGGARSHRCQTSPDLHLLLTIFCNSLHFCVISFCLTAVELTV